jgi:hypothetical protein
MGAGFSGGLVELAALGKLTEQDVYLCTELPTSWCGSLVTWSRRRAISH